MKGWFLSRSWKIRSFLGKHSKLNKNRCPESLSKFLVLSYPEKCRWGWQYCRVRSKSERSVSQMSARCPHLSTTVRTCPPNVRRLRETPRKQRCPHLSAPVRTRAPNVRRLRELADMGTLGGQILHFWTSMIFWIGLTYLVRQSLSPPQFIITTYHHSKSIENRCLSPMSQFLIFYLEGKGKFSDPLIFSRLLSDPFFC